MLADTRATPDSSEQREARDDSIRLLGEAGREPFWEETFGRGSLHRRPTRPSSTGRTGSPSSSPSRASLPFETIRDRVDSRPTLPSIDVPVAVLVGEEDGLTPPADSEAMVAALPDALFALQARGHLAPLERPTRLPS